MNKSLFAIFILFIASSVAQATAVVSNVSYTSNSITFTETGDLSGYTSPSQNDQFGIVYTGNLLSYGSYQPNSFSGNLFSNDTVAGGNTGNFGGPNAYTWTSSINGDMSSDLFSGTAFTISWAQPMLNTSGSGTFEFVWGNGYGAPTTVSVLNSVNVVNGNVVNGNVVPEPATLALLGLGLFGFAAARRRKQ